MEKGRYVLLCGTVVDGTVKDPFENAVLVIEGSRIAAVGGKGEVEIPKDAKTIDLREKTIIPGLIDSHIHISGGRGTDRQRSNVNEPQRAIRAAVDARNMLLMGYTGAKDCGSTIGIGLKRAIEEGTTIGPRIMTSGRALNNTYGHIGTSPVPVEIANAMGTSFADGVPECLKAVRTRLREGADFIKIASGLWGESRIYPKCMPSFSFEEIKAICDEAHRAHTTVASHCQGKESIMISLEAGVDTFEHAREFDEECAKLMLKKGKIYSPTLAVVIAGDDDQRYSQEEKRLFNKWQFDSVRIAHEYGVKIASGSDFGGLRLTQCALDLQRLVEAGLSSHEAIVSATRVSAEAMMMQDKIGTLEPGKLADIVVVNGNPLEDIRMLQDERRIGMVWKGGEIVAKRF